MKIPKTETLEIETVPETQPDGPMLVEWWPIDKVVPYHENARKLSHRAVSVVATSLREFGWRQPIVVDAAGVIIAGHTRRLAAIAEAMTRVPVHVALNLTEAQVRAYRLMDNRSNDEAQWNMELLGLEMAGLQAIDFDLSLTGFDQREIDAFAPEHPDEDIVIATPDVPVSKLGDLWLLGPHRVLCGSCTQEQDVARVLNGALPLLMVTDPPYGVELDGEWRDRAGLNSNGPGGKRSSASKEAAKAKPTASAEPNYLMKRSEGHHATTISGDTRADWSQAFELVPSLQVAYVWHASKFTCEVLQGLLRIGFIHHQQIIWDKGRTVMTRTHYWFQHEPCWYVRKEDAPWFGTYLYEHEPCFYVRKKNAPWFGKAGKNSTVWESPSPKFMMGSSEEEKFDHPTQKPVDLMRRPILNHTKPGELIYEPFLGSGTTLAAAELSGRVCSGLELDPKFVDVVVLRWQGITGEEARLEDGRTFAEVAASRTVAA